MTKIDSNLCIMDIEVISDHQLDYYGFPVEIAWKDPETGSMEHIMINPELASERSLPPYKVQDFFDFQTFTDLSLEELVEHGISPQEAAQYLNEKLNGKLVYFDGGLEHDKSWLKNLFNEANLDIDFKMRSLSQFLQQHFGLKATRIFNALEIQISETAKHRAVPDVEDIERIFKDTVNEFKKLIEKKSDQDHFTYS